MGIKLKLCNDYEQPPLFILSLTLQQTADAGVWWITAGIISQSQMEPGTIPMTLV